MSYNTGKEIIHQQVASRQKSRICTYRDDGFAVKLACYELKAVSLMEKEKSGNLEYINLKHSPYINTLITDKIINYKITKRDVVCTDEAMPVLLVI